MSRLGVLSLRLVILVVSLWAIATPAAVAGDAPPPASTPPSPEEKTTVVGTCVLYANPAGMGADCVSGDGTSDKVDLNKLFAGKDRVCRHDPWPHAEPPPGMDAEDRPGAYYIKRCVERDPSGPDKGQVRYTFDYVFYESGTHIEQLTDEQLSVWVWINNAYPLPILDTFPHKPRVYTDTSFGLGGHDNFIVTEDVYAGAPRGWITMKAEVETTTFTVETPRGKEVALRDRRRGEWPCTVTGPALLDDGTVCTGEFRRSTAIFGDDGIPHPDDNDQYYVGTTLNWRVTYYPRGNPAAETVLGTFEVPLGSYLGVSEIQTLNR